VDEQPVTGGEFSTPERDAHRLRNGIIWAAALLVLLFAIGLAVPDLRSVLHRVADAAPGWLVAAVALEVLSCLGYVATVRLVLRRGPRREVRHLAWAEMAFGAVVPIGGAGGLAVGAWAMRAWNLPWRLIASRSAVIFLLTSAINAATLALSAIAYALGIGAGGGNVIYGVIPAAVALGALGAFAVLPVLVRRADLRPRRSRTALVLYRTADWVQDTTAVVRGGDWRLLGAVAYLLCDIAVLWVCLRAVGTAPPLMAVVVGYQIGYLANLIPVPGGVGVLEGGLLGALLLYGLPAAPTAAAVVLYHAVALWVPALGGTVGFARLRTAVANGLPAASRLREATPAPAPAELRDAA
jgi:uncharacterized membrane protein YbhN (UPF0104 family)